MILVFHGLVSFFFAISGGLVLFLLPKDKITLLSKRKSYERIN